MIMREILFRGKTNFEGRDSQWVYGSLLAESSNTFPIIAQDYDNDEDWIGIIEWATVDPETVGQYTGLTDKNGKKIFEGDIVQGTIVSAWNKALIRCEVVYNKDGFISVERTRNQDWVHKVKFAKDIEVIGNIHDNPELLGE